MSILSPVTLAIDVKMDQGLSQVFEKYKYVLRISLERHIVIDYRDYHNFDNFSLKLACWQTISTIWGEKEWNYETKDRKTKTEGSEIKFCIIGIKYFWRSCLSTILSILIKAIFLSSVSRALLFLQSFFYICVQ